MKTILDTLIPLALYTQRDYPHAASFKMYYIGFRAFKSPANYKTHRLVSVGSSLPCINIGVRTELTFNKNTTDCEIIHRNASK